VLSLIWLTLKIITGIDSPLAEYIGNMKLLITAFEEQRAIPMYSELTESRKARLTSASLSRWSAAGITILINPQVRVTSANSLKGFHLVDNRNCRDSDGTADPRATPDNTEINYCFVLEILRFFREPGKKSWFDQSYFCFQFSKYKNASYIEFQVPQPTFTWPSRQAIMHQSHHDI
jgi:hypothetical protein